MATRREKSSRETEIWQVMDSFADAIRNKDLERVMSFYSSEVVWFDFMAPLRHTGADEYRKVWEQCFDWFESPIEMELRDLNVAAADDLAFSHSLIHLKQKFKNGQKLDFWMRATTCFRKI